MRFHLFEELFYLGASVAVPGEGSKWAVRRVIGVMASVDFDRLSERSDTCCSVFKYTILTSLY